MEAGTYRRAARLPLAERQAVTAIALAFAALTAVVAFRLPAFFGPDERAHFSYVVSLLEGDLPEIDDKIPVGEGYPVVDASRAVPYTHEVVWVANHPPLFYVVAAPFAWVAGLVGPDSWPPLTLRLLNLAFMAVGVGATGLLAAELFPGRRLVPVAAAAVAATTPNLVGIASYGHNDGLAFALVGVGLVVAARLARAGPAPRLVATAAVLAATAALTRASLALLVAALAAAALLGAWRHQPSGRRTAVNVLAPPLAVGGAAVVAAGWFFRRNARLYGTATGDAYLFEWLDRPTRGSTLEVLVRSRFHTGIWSQLYSSVHSHLVLPGRMLVLAALVAVVVGGGACAWRRGGGPAAGRAPWLVCGLLAAGVVVTTAQFYAHGGTPHARYLFPLVPVVSVVLARAALALPAGRRVAAVVVGGLAVVTLSQLARYPALIAGPEPVHPFVQPSAGPAWQIAAGLAAVAAAGAAVAAARRAAATGTAATGTAATGIAAATVEPAAGLPIAAAGDQPQEAR